MICTFTFSFLRRSIILSAAIGFVFNLLVSFLSAFSTASELTGSNSTWSNVLSCLLAEGLYI